MIFEWLVNYLVHSSILLGLATVCTSLPRWREPAFQDLIWKVALLAGIFTATIQTAGPLGSGWQLGAPQRVERTPATPPAVPVPANPTLESPAAGTGTADVFQAVQQPAATPAQSRKPVQSPVVDSRALGLLLWTFGAGLSLLGFVRTLLAQHRLLADRRLLDRAAAQALVADLPVRRLRISTTDRIDNPLVTVRDEIVLPEAFDALPARQRRAALAHELGHLIRRDPLWRLLARLINCLLFIQPLNRLAEKRLRSTAELLSDRHAVRLTGDRSALAESLASFAAATRRPLPATACAMISGGSTLTTRIRNLLENHPMILLNAKQLWLAALVTVAAGALALPGVSDGRDWFGDDDTRGTTVNVEDHGDYSEIHVSHRDGRRRIELDAEGRIEFAADESDIIGLSEGGYFELEVTENGIERRVEIENDDGALRRRFRVDGNEQPYDDAARRWLAGILPEVFRLTGIDSEARVGRLLQRGGPASVISEIQAINSDLVARIYASELARQADLDEAQLEVLLQTLREGVDSDLELRLALSALMEHQALSGDNWQTLIEASRMLGSDLEQRLTLTRAAELMPVEAALVEAYVVAAGDIGSDLEARLALQAISEHLPAASEALLVRVIQGTTAIGSDLEQRLALQSIAPAMTSPAVFQAYVEAAREIGSDLETRLTYQYFLDAGPPSAVATAMVNAAADAISSDFELRLLLGNVLDDYSDDSDVRQAVLDAANGIGSSHERNLLLSRLAR